MTQPIKFSVTIRITGTYNAIPGEDVQQHLEILSDYAVDRFTDNLFGQADNIRNDNVVYLEGWKRDRDIP